MSELLVTKKLMHIEISCACDNTSFRITSYTDAMNISKKFTNVMAKKHLSSNNKHINLLYIIIPLANFIEQI